MTTTFKIVILALAALLVGPVVAQATTEVSSTDQQWLAAHGMGVADDDAWVDSFSTASPSILVRDPCPRTHLHSRRVGTKIEGERGHALVRIGAKTQVCVNNGQINQVAADFRHASPGRSWSTVGVPIHYWRNVYHTAQKEYVAKQCFRFGAYGSADTWLLSIKVRWGPKHGTDHQAWNWTHRVVSSDLC